MNEGFLSINARDDFTHEFKCRFCAKATEPLTYLGELALTSFFPKPGQPCPKIPLSVRRCPNCGLVQLGENTNPDLMYREGYGYKSGTNESMVEHLNDIARLFGRVIPQPEKGDAVLDIGCNDGTLLKVFSPTLIRYGVDPIGSPVEGCTVERKFFAYDPDRPKFKVITSLAMFYDLPRPLSFVMDVERSLAEGGVWIVEVQYAPKLLEGYWDGICHEHLTYWGLSQLRPAAGQVGLYLQHFEFNDVNGGSILCVFGREKLAMGSEVSRSAQAIIEKERSLGWDELHDVIRFSAKNVRSAVNGRRVYALGASTKGNTLLQTAFLDNQFIKAAVERNPEKIGKVTPGTGIPIISEEDAWANPPEAFLVLPYHFREGLLKRYERFREQGVKFIFPLPTVEEV
jgi:NDP-4-keto-2,6-dideoxyhexose 3-C-methyltransferase